MARASVTSTAPLKGERVRVTVEGVVDHTSDVGYFEIDGSGFDVSAPGTSFEVIVDPLPTTPGSVVRQGGSFFHLTPEGYWISDGGNDYAASEMLGGNPITIVWGR